MAKALSIGAYGRYGIEDWLLSESKAVEEGVISGNCIVGRYGLLETKGVE